MLGKDDIFTRNFYQIFYKKMNDDIETYNFFKVFVHNQHFGSVKSAILTSNKYLKQTEELPEMTLFEKCILYNPLIYRKKLLSRDADFI